MLVYTIFSIYKVNRERVNSLFMRVLCASSLTDGVLLFHSEINCQKGDLSYLFTFCFDL